MGPRAWPSRRALAQRGCRVEGQGRGFSACLAVDQRHGAAAGRNQGPSWRQTEREPLVWTERSWRMEPQGCKRFPLLDPAECCQAWGRERSTGPKATLQGESILFPLGAPWARFLTTRSLCFFLCESPTLTSLPAILGAV